MKRLPPSATMREELDKLLRGGTEAEGNIVSALGTSSPGSCSKLSKQEADFLGRGAAWSAEERARGAHVTVMSRGACARRRCLLRCSSRRQEALESPSLHLDGLFGGKLRGA